MEKIKKHWLEIIGGVVVIICLFYIVIFLNNLFNSLYINSKTTECHEIYGSFGSYVGGILGTIIGFVTLILVYKTYTSQKEELKLQRQLIAQQQFESTFFNLLNTHRELKKELVMFKLTQLNIIISGSASSIEKEKLVGVEVLEEVNNHFINYFYKITKRKINFTEIFNDNKFSIRDFKLEEDIKEYNKKIENDNSEKNILTFIYKKIFDKFQDEISHYCRNVYHILKFIRENEENEQNLNNKLSFRKYADIFQSQLNVNEQFLLFYNFIHFNENDNEEYLHPMNIVNHYKFLENLGSNNLLDKELHNNKNFYTFDIK